MESTSEKSDQEIKLPVLTSQENRLIAIEKELASDTFDILVPDPLNKEITLDLVKLCAKIARALINDYKNFLNHNTKSFEEWDDRLKSDFVKQGISSVIFDIYGNKDEQGNLTLWENSELKKLCNEENLRRSPDNQIVFNGTSSYSRLPVNHAIVQLFLPYLQEPGINGQIKKDLEIFNRELERTSIRPVDFPQDKSYQMDYSKKVQSREDKTFPNKDNTYRFKQNIELLISTLSIFDPICSDVIRNALSNIGFNIDQVAYYLRGPKTDQPSDLPITDPSLPRTTSTEPNITEKPKSTNPALKRPSWADQPPKPPAEGEKK